MMESLHVAVAVLSLLSLGQTAPTTNCESLTKRIQIPGRDQLLGRWNLIAESTDVVSAKQLLEMSRITLWANYVAATEENIMIGSMHLKMAGLCFSMTFNSTLENNTFTLTYPYSTTSFQLKTGCPDCMVLYYNATFGRSSYRGVQLLSRRPKVSAAELQEFKKQVECLNLPEAAFLDPNQGFCPDPSLSKDSTSFDVTSFMGAGDMKMIDEIFRSGAAVETFSEMFSQIFSTFGETVEN
ncbi:uncharacterized protein LOC103468914 [Poecilia reticulata]|uniref:uncharacterized protein LOC103468914 n=1 Tax=Poecilia reticulata TaxID=8081 RepID=UPI0004A3896F|nr:PREDICTED: uncharacterized protein LOC103468914 [Poecilia reticulata]